MTRLELRTAIKSEARVKTGANLDPVIDSMVEDILRDYGNKARYREVLILDQPITLVDSQASYALPVDFQHMQTVRFSQDGRRFRPLYEFNEGQNRVSVSGWPRYYQLHSGGIQVFPSEDLRTTNTLFICYYRDPSALFADDADEFPIPRLEGAVKKMAIARITRYMQQLNESAAAAQDATASFIAGQGGQ